MMPCKLVNSCQYIERFASSILREDGESYYRTALKVRAGSCSSISECFASQQVIILNYYRAAVRTLSHKLQYLYVHMLSCHLHMFAGILFPVCKEIWQLQCLILCQKEMTTQRMRTQQRYVSDNTLHHCITSFR